MIKFLDKNKNPINLDHTEDIHAYLQDRNNNDLLIGICRITDLPSSWDCWEIHIPEIHDSRAHLLKYLLANLWVSMNTTMRFLPKNYLLNDQQEK